MAVVKFEDNGRLAEGRAVTASAGEALSTASKVIPLAGGANYASLIGRNYSTAVVARVAPVPFLVVMKTADNLATATDYTNAAQDGDAGTDVVLSSLDTFANGDFLMVGAALPFRGAIIDVDAANGTANNLTVKYWDGDSWADISATDNTDTGASLAQDGTVTWTVPSDWTAVALTATTVPTPAASVPYGGLSLYWTRWEWNVALDSSTTLNSLMALARSTAYVELVAGQELEFEYNKAPGGIAGIEALTDAGTANLIINCFARQPNRIL